MLNTTYFGSSNFYIRDLNGYIIESDNFFGPEQFEYCLGSGCYELQTDFSSFTYLNEYNI